MVELADTPDLGSGSQECRFKSCYPHERGLIYFGVSLIYQSFSYLLYDSQMLQQNLKSQQDENNAACKFCF